MQSKTWSDGEPVEQLRVVFGARDVQVVPHPTDELGASVDLRDLFWGVRAVVKGLTGDDCATVHLPACQEVWEVCTVRAGVEHAARMLGTPVVVRPHGPSTHYPDHLHYQTSIPGMRVWALSPRAADDTDAGAGAPLDNAPPGRAA